MKKYGTHLLDLFVYYTMSDNDNKSYLLNLWNTELYICQDKFISICENKGKKVVPAYLYHSQCG